MNLRSSIILLGVALIFLGWLVNRYYFTYPLPPSVAGQPAAVQPANAPLPARVSETAQGVELPTAAPVAPAAHLPAGTAANPTQAEKAMLTRQALAARGPAPKFSQATPAQPPIAQTALEQRVMDLLADAPSTTHIETVDIFELDEGSASSYHLRKEVVRIPIPAAAGQRSFVDHMVFYLPSANHFYVVWEGMGASTLHYRGPLEGNPYDMLGIPQASKAGP